MKKIFNLFVFVFLLGSLTSFGQDAEFSQFYVNNMYLNPAMVGGSKCPKSIMSYRNQWTAYGGDYTTALASYEEYSKNIKGGIGIMFVNDQSRGVLSYNNISAAYSNNQDITRNFSMRLGFQGSFTQERINYDGLTFPDMINPYYGFIYPTQEPYQEDVIRYFDLSAGLIGYGDRGYVGVAVHHINEPNESFLYNRSRLPMKSTIHAGYKIPIRKDYYGEKSSLTPNIMYRRQGEFQQLNFGLNVQQTFFNYNIWYRGWLGENFRDAVIVGFGVKIDNLKINYTYDITVSQLTPSTGGTHEISLRIDYPCRENIRKFKSIPCTEF